jgi:putative ABC transport system permease protein
MAMGLARDVRYGARRLRLSPFFTLGIAVTLTLAIAANVAVFSAVSATLLGPLSIREPERVLVMSETDAGRGQAVREVSYRNFVDWRTQSRAFTGLAAVGSTTWDLLLDRQDGVSRVKAAPVSAAFFDVLGAVPRLGRGFVPTDDERGAARVIVLGDGLWRREFGGDPAVVGSRVVLSGDSFTIVGVMAPEFAYPPGAEAWTPVTTTLPTVNARFQVDALELRSFGLLYVVGRLSPGVSVEQARAEVEGIARRLPDTKIAGDGAGIAARPLLDDIFGATRRGLILLLAMVGVVLLIACANVSSLVIARASNLRAVFAVKSALGARRSQLIQEWAVEIGLVTVVSAGTGVLLASIALEPLMAMAPSSFPRLHRTRIDLPVLSFAAGVCIVATLLCAVVPALHASALGAKDALRRAPVDGGPRAARVRGLLTAAQIAFATVVIIGAGLLVRSFDQLRRIDLGFEPRHVLTLNVEPQTKTAVEYRLAYDAIIERVAAVPGVNAVGAVHLRPLSEGKVGMDSGYLLEGQRIDQPETWKNNVR